MATSETFLYLRYLLTFMQPYGRVVHEKYTVERVDQIKCWTCFRLKDSNPLFLRRLSTCQDLLEDIVGNDIVINRIEQPPLPNSIILKVTYHGKIIYPVISNIN